MSKYVTNNRFQPFASNTICDVTGFKVKTNEVMERWEGFYVIPEAWHPRQPQDFPPNILKTQVYPQTRFEQVDPVAPVAPPEII